MTSGLEFTEQMRGFVTLDETDPERGYAQGRKDGTGLMFHLTIGTQDVDAFVADPAHEATATGWVDCDLLGGRRPVEKGTFNLFVGSEPGERRMLYRLFLADAAGHPLTLSGFKEVRDDRGFDIWRDTSTLFTTVLAGHVDKDAQAGARVVAAGVITIHIPDFMRQLTTFRGTPQAMAAFGRLFLGQLWDVYGHRLGASGGTA